MQGARLTGAKMQGADLENAKMQGANLENAKMQGANLESASMQSADLFGASMQGADVEGASMQGADLRWSHQYGATGTVNIRLADLRDADFVMHTSEKGVAQLPEVATSIDLKAYGLPNSFITAHQHLVSVVAKWHDSIEHSERDLSAAQHANAPLPTYEAAPHSVLVVISGQHGRRPYPLRLRPFVTGDKSAYFTALATYFAHHVAAWGPRAAAMIANAQLRDLDGDKPTPRQRVIGCALLAANNVSFAGHEEILVELKKKYPQSMCHPSAAHSPNTVPPPKAPAPATRHAAN